MKAFLNLTIFWHGPFEPGSGALEDDTGVYLWLDPDHHIRHVGMTFGQTYQHCCVQGFKKGHGTEWHREFPGAKPMILIGSLVIEPGTRVSEALLEDVETLLIFDANTHGARLLEQGKPQDAHALHGHTLRIQNDFVAADIKVTELGDYIDGDDLVASL